MLYHITAMERTLALSRLTLGLSEADLVKTQFACRDNEPRQAKGTAGEHRSDQVAAATALVRSPPNSSPASLSSLPDDTQLLIIEQLEHLEDIFNLLYGSPSTYRAFLPHATSMLFCALNRSTWCPARTAAARMLDFVPRPVLLPNFVLTFPCRRSGMAGIEVEDEEGFRRAVATQRRNERDLRLLLEESQSWDA